MGDEAHEPPKVFVTCDLCGVETELAKGDWFARCKNENCLGKGTTILAPTEENTRYFRYSCICEEVVHYGLAVPPAKIHICCDCNRKHVITDTVEEIRNNQMVYGTERKTTIVKDFDEAKEKLKHSEKEVEELRGEVKRLEKYAPTVDELILKYINQSDVVAKNQKECDEMKEQLKKTEEEVERLRKKGKDFEEEKKIIRRDTIKEVEKLSIQCQEQLIEVLKKKSEEETNEIEKLREEREAEKKSRIEVEEKLEKECAKYKEELLVLRRQMDEQSKELHNLTEEKEVEMKTRVLANEKFETLSKEMEKMKKENMENSFKIKFLEQVLEEKKKDTEVFRQLLLKRTSSSNEEDISTKQLKEGP